MAERLRLFDRKRAFALIELLIVMGVILILASIMVLTWPAVRERFVKIRCQTNLRKAQKIMFEYGVNNTGYLPPVTGSGTNGWNRFLRGGIGSEDRPHYVVVELKEYGASAEIFTCPAWPGYGDPNHYVNEGWENPRDRVYTGGYSMYVGFWPWVTGTNWQWHPWLLPDARKKADRIDSPGNPPIMSDEINYDPNSWSGVTWQGFYHRRDRYHRCDRDNFPGASGGGGHTLFLSGAVNWFTWDELVAMSQEDPAPVPFRPHGCSSRMAFAGPAPREDQ